jgi:hypothetical protein
MAGTHLISSSRDVSLLAFSFLRRRVHLDRRGRPRKRKIPNFRKYRAALSAASHPSLSRATSLCEHLTIHHARAPFLTHQTRSLTQHNALSLSLSCAHNNTLHTLFTRYTHCSHSTHLREVDEETMALVKRCGTKEVRRTVVQSSSVHSPLCVQKVAHRLSHTEMQMRA